jgi:hypothetical protein
MAARIALLGVLICLLLAGCVGTVDQQETGSPLPAEKITAYEYMNTASQETFETLRLGHTITRTQQNIPRDIWNTEYISYNDTVYKIDREVLRGISIRELQLKTVDATTIENDSQVIPFETLSPEARNAFNRSRRGVYETRDPMPSQLVDSYILYQDRYYRPVVISGDLVEMRLSLNKTTY